MESKSGLSRIIRILCLGLAGFSIQPVLAADSCSSDVINALKSEYTLEDNSEVSDYLYENHCKSSRLYMAGEGSYGPYSGSGENKSVEEACFEREKDYFRRNRIEMSYSALPADVVDKWALNCDPGLTMKAKVQGEAVTLEYRFNQMVGARDAIIEEYTISNPSVLSCEDEWLKPRWYKKWFWQPRIGVGGETVTCVWTGTESVTVSMKTNHNSKSIVIHKPFSRRAVWNVDTIHAPDQPITNPTVDPKSFECIESAAGFSQTVQCNAMCDEKYGGGRALRIAACQEKFGTFFIQSRGAEIPVPDKWTYDAGGKDKLTVNCRVNSKLAGHNKAFVGNFDKRYEWFEGVGLKFASRGDMIRATCASKFPRDVYLKRPKKE